MKPSNRRMKDSGIPWIGEIPEEWIHTKIRYVALQRSGHTPSRQHPEYWQECTIPWFTLADVWQLRDGKKKYLGNTKEMISDLGLSRSAAELLPAGTVVLSRTASVGFSGIMPIAMATTQDFVNWVCGSRIHHEYLWYVFRSMKPEFDRLIMGSTHKTIYMPDAAEFRTPLPSLPEQRAFAAFLDRKCGLIDALIEKKQALIQRLKELRQATIDNAVTHGLDPNAVMKDSGVEWIGQVPVHWREYPLKALFSLKHGFAFDGAAFSYTGEYILMTPGNFIESGGFRKKVPEKFYVGTDIPEDFILKGGQILIAMTEQTPGLLGCALFVPNEETYLHNQRLGLVQGLKSETVDERFLFYLLNSSRFRAEISVSSTGSKVKHTSPEKILGVKVSLPPLTEQCRISGFVDRLLSRIDTLVKKAEQAILLFQEYRQAVISNAVTGKIEVPSLEEVEA